MSLRTVILDAWALLHPVDCAGCGVPDRALCDECAASLVPCPAVHATPAGLRVIAAVQYRGRVRHMLLQFKEHDRTDVVAPLARSLDAALTRASPGGAVEFVPVPMSRAARRRRGYEPVAILLARTGRRPSRVLRASRATAAQKGLGAVARADNLRGAFRASTDLTGREFVIVDDILTTGATLDEAARALSEAGGTVVGAATLAFTPRLLRIRDKRSGQDYGGAKGAQ